MIRYLLKLILLLTFGMSSLFMTGIATPLVHDVKDYFDYSDNKGSVYIIMDGSSHGTGFAIARDLILTNAHVVAGQQVVFVQSEDAEVKLGTVIAADLKSDLALVHVPDLQAIPLKLADTKTLKPGDHVYALGHGRGAFYDRVDGYLEAKYFLNVEKNTYLLWMADMPIRPGHSGSPVINDEGEVVGVVTRGGGGKGLFIPNHYVYKFLEFVRQANQKHVESK